MATKSNKNILTIIVISSVLLFIAAIYWKQTNQSNAEIVNVVQKPISPKVDKVQADDLSFLEDDYIVQDTYRDDIDEKYQNQEATKKKLSNFLYFTMMYKTPEEVMEGIIYFQEKGNEEKENELIQFLLERFPDYKIPNNI